MPQIVCVLGEIQGSCIEDNGILTFDVKDPETGVGATIKISKEKLYSLNSAKVEKGNGCAIYGWITDEEFDKGRMRKGLTRKVFEGITGRVRRIDDGTNDIVSNELIKIDIEDAEKGINKRRRIK